MTPRAGAPQACAPLPTALSCSSLHSLPTTTGNHFRAWPRRFSLLRALSLSSATTVQGCARDPQTARGSIIRYKDYGMRYKLALGAKGYCSERE